jgi:hypothetical protein
LVTDPVLSDRRGHRNFFTITVSGRVPAEDVAGKQAQPAVARPLKRSLHECFSHNVRLVAAEFDFVYPFLDPNGDGISGVQQKFST